MASAVLTLPEKVKSELKRFSWVKWSELASQEVIQEEGRIKAWREAERIVAKSGLTQEKADKLADEASWSLARKYGELLKGKK